MSSADKSSSRGSSRRHTPEPDRGEASASVMPEGSLDPVYEAKARVLNDAMREIGFGKYHKALFVVAGFGWLADNVRPRAIYLSFGRPVTLTPRHISCGPK